MDQSLNSPNTSHLLLPPPTAFTDSIAQTLELSEGSRADLHVFREVSAHMNANDLRVEIFKFAMFLRTQQMIQRQSTEYQSIITLLEQVKRAMEQSVSFTNAQKLEMRAACRFAVWDPSRTDYGNPAVCEAAHDYLKENCAVNGLEDIFDNPSQSRTAALNHQLSVEASYVKGILKDLVRAGVLPEPGKTKTSLTKSVRDGMSKFTGSRKNSTVQHAIHLLILRAFARTKPHLLKESTRSKESQPPSESMTEQTVVAVDRSQKQRAPGTAANRTDFFSCLTTFFQEHQEKWGDNVSNGGWVKYIDDAIQVERREHPEDLLPIIPTRDSSASAASTSTGTPVYNPSLPGQVESHGGTFMTPPPPSNLSQFSALFLSPGVSN